MYITTSTNMIRFGDVRMALARHGRSIHNWTYAWGGPAFVDVPANAFRKCGQFTGADAGLAGYHGAGSEDSILAALETVFAGNVSCTKTPGKGQCDGW